jgi:hypothetical protein
MPAYLVTYDLRRPGRHDRDLRRVLEDEYRATLVLPATWVLRTPATAKQVADDLLARALDPDDGLVVVPLSYSTAWSMLDISDAAMDALVVGQRP